MKILVIGLISIFLSASLLAQAPQAFKYQAVARNSSGEIIQNQPVGMRISILQGSANGNAVYTETFSEQTNEFGLINLNIGTGQTDDDFTAINWSTGVYFIKIEMDINGGTNYIEYSTSQLLSVPYALYADNAATSNYSFSPSYPNGFQNITPVTFSITEGNSYTVPSGKILYILNIYHDHSAYGNSLNINGIGMVYGNCNYGYDFSLTLSQPLLANEGDIISSAATNFNPFHVNGFLVDK